MKVVESKYNRNNLKGNAPKRVTGDEEKRLMDAGYAKLCNSKLLVLNEEFIDKNYYNDEVREELKTYDSSNEVLYNFCSHDPSCFFSCIIAPGGWLTRRLA